MKDKVKNMISLLLLISMAACDFSEECIYYGTLEAHCKWLLSDDQQFPGHTEMNITYYPITGEATKDMIGKGEAFEKDTITRKLHIGKYDLLVFNKRGNQVRGLENYLEDAEIYSITETRNGKSYIVNQQEMIYSGILGNQEIFTDDTTRCTFLPRILVQEIQFEIHLTGMNEFVEEVYATLDGVSTNRFLATGEKGLDYASLEFPTQQITDKRYDAKILVLGINNTPSNLLIIRTHFKEGFIAYTPVDLSEVLKKFTADKVYIRIEVEIGDHMNTIGRIMEWGEYDWGEIKINR